MASSLTTISNLAELTALKELHLKDWPKHCVGFYWLDNYLRWLQKNPNTKYLTFYTLNGNWRRDGLFILVHRYQLFFSNLSRQKTPELLTALTLMDWTRGYKVSAIHETHHAIYKQLLAEHHLFMDREMKTIMYRLPCEQAKELQVNCPPGYFLDNVRLEHAELINELWSAKHPGSLKLIQLLIEMNTNVGLYDQATGQLCAWCLRLQSGFLGALEVLPTHQRRGLGLVVAAAIAKRISGDLNHDVTALVNLNNTAACRVFEKLQFMLIKGEHYYWSMCLPTAESSLSWLISE
ncbi:hypothetical protein AWZ03_013148 [Drosophila navojoa]|uniref:GCN5-related N-acetyltransferase Rv2170-like domain-containing protein n=1 Tax=Drosophila navojoa TaxID=7232 RepID=A0A484AWQ4_DRONA|nr:uncharacterized protein LOC115564725 [Drosophila navojoa]TDG40432.1 hypothetical protein AWZ03_013148 [Drosophila navojoa]